MLIGLNMWRELGDPNYIALGLNFMVTTIIKLEHYDEAKAFMHESIKLCEQTKNHWGLGTAHRYLGLALMAEGQYREAQACFQRSLDVFGEYTEGWDIALSLIYLGDAIMRSGNFAGAENNYKEALRVSMEAGSIPLILDALSGIAEIQQRTGNFKRAFEFSQFILHHPACTQDTKERVSQILSEVDRCSGIEQMGMSQEKISNQSLEELVGTLLK